MSVTKGKMSSEESESEIMLHDLQTLLQGSLGKEVIVINYETESLLAKNEHFGSMMLKVEALIKRNQNAKEECLHLVAKMYSVSRFSNSNMDATRTFQKEIYVFKNLLSVYRALERQVGIPDSMVIQTTPKFYGARISLNGESHEADTDVVILTENLRAFGYSLMDRKKGLDLDHAKFAINELARYHALGVVCKHQNPEFFEKTKNSLSVPFMKQINGWDYTIELTKKALYADPRIKAYENRISKIIEKGWVGHFKESSDNIWLSITHGDFWTNNMMFHHDENGKPDKIKFFDFQLTSYNTCLRDIFYFLTNACSVLVMTDYLEEVLNTYYDSFTQTLKRLNFDCSKYTRENFDTQMELEAREILFFALLALKFVMFDIPEDFQMNDFMRDVMEAEVHDNFKNKAYETIRMCLRKNWL